MGLTHNRGKESRYEGVALLLIHRNQQQANSTDPYYSNLSLPGTDRKFSRTLLTLVILMKHTVLFLASANILPPNFPRSSHYSKVSS